ncbi:MAG: hypothetical protein ISS29_03860 [Candidatus Marinimicrobia bacterium]|nr:hypothetical protein [Candidatus Neomarinimicrobiota bacterium]
MLKKILLVSILLCISSLFAKDKVAIIPTSDYHTNVNIVDELTVYMVNCGKYSIVDRASMETILGEMVFQLSDVSNEAVIKIGGLLNVKYIITVSKIGSNVTAKMIDVSTAQIVNAATDISFQKIANELSNTTVSLPSSTNKDKIAILKFDTIMLEGVARDFEKKLEAKMMKLNKYSIIDRNNLRNILDEQEFQFSDKSDGNGAELGQILNVDYIIVGYIDRYQVTVKMIDIKTGEVVKAMAHDTNTPVQMFSSSLLINMRVINAIAKKLSATDNLSEKVEKEKIAISSFGRTFQNELTAEMIKCGKYSVIDRLNIQQILKEQKFQLSDISSDDYKEIGELLNVKYVVTGSVSSEKAMAKMIDVSTGEIVKASVQSTYDSRKQSSVLFNGHGDAAKYIAKDLSGIKIDAKKRIVKQGFKTLKKILVLVVLLCLSSQI